MVINLYSITRTKNEKIKEKVQELLANGPRK